MKIKKMLCLALAITCCIGILATSAFAKKEMPFDNYVKNKTMYNYTFKDVKRSDWYYSCIKNCYELGLINGKGNNTFEPDGNMTVGEAIAFVVRAHVRRNGTPIIAPFDNTDPLYATYVDYAMRHHFKLFNTKLNKDVEIDWSVRNYIDLDRKITFAEFWVLAYSALGENDLYGSILTASDIMLDIYPCSSLHSRIVAYRNSLENDLTAPITRAAAARIINCFFSK